MQLKNRFSEEDKIRYWVDHPYCVICKSNQNCSLHHINGCKEDYHRSIYNSSMLCYEHHKQADGHNTSSPQSMAFRKMLLQITCNRITQIGRNNNKWDDAFLSSLKGMGIT